MRSRSDIFEHGLGHHTCLRKRRKSCKWHISKRFVPDEKGNEFPTFFQSNRNSEKASSYREVANGNDPMGTSEKSERRK